jgi:hypothetical protein
MGDKSVLRAATASRLIPVPVQPSAARPLSRNPDRLLGSRRQHVSASFNNIIKAFRTCPTPDVSTGQLTLPTNLDMGPRSPWGGHLNRGYIQSWNLTFERRLPWEMIGSVGYVATRTINQLLDRNINTVGPGLGITTANLPLAQGPWPHHRHEHVGRLGLQRL